MYDLVVIGNPSFNRFISEGNNGRRVISGPSPFSIVTASKLGLENIAIIGAVGTDYDLQFRTTMHELGVPEYFVLDSKKTGGLELKETANGEYTFRSYIDEARKIGIREVPDEFLSSRAILLAPMLHEIDEEFIQWICNSSDAHIYLDPQIASPKENGDIVAVKDFETFEKTQCVLDCIQMNREEAALFTGESDPFVSAELLVDMLTEVCILTMGPDGCLVYDDNEFIQVSAYPAKAIDTFCAGSVHLAGYISSMLKSKSIADCVALGSALASIKVETFGLNYRFEESDLAHRKAWIDETIQHR